MSKRHRRARESAHDQEWVHLKCEVDVLEELLPGFVEERIPAFHWEDEWDAKAEQYRRVTHVSLPGGGAYTVHLDRLIFNAPVDAEIVHLNGNLLDNRRSNLAMRLFGRLYGPLSAVDEEMARAGGKSTEESNIWTRRHGGHYR